MSVMSHEPLCLDSLQDRLFFFDDFEGDQLKDEWRAVGTGSSVVVDLQMGGIVRLTTGAIDNNSQAIDWTSIRSLHVSKRLSAEMRVKLNQITYLSVELKFLFDGDNRIFFYFNETVGGAINWSIYCEDAGVPTQLDSGVAVDTDYHIYRFECHLHGGSHVHFYIDDVETDNSPIATNVPDDAGDYLNPRLILLTREDVAKSMDIDYVYIRQDR